MAKASIRKASAKKAQEGRVVEAAMSAGSGGAISGAVRLDPLAIEEAMAKATEKALRDGVTDPDKIRKLKLAARERVKDEHRAAEKKALAAVEQRARRGR